MAIAASACMTSSNQTDATQRSGLQSISSQTLGGNMGAQENAQVHGVFATALMRSLRSSATVHAAALRPAGERRWARRGTPHPSHSGPAAAIQPYGTPWLPRERDAGGPVIGDCESRETGLAATHTTGRLGRASPGLYAPHSRPPRLSRQGANAAGPTFSRVQVWWWYLCIPTQVQPTSTGGDTTKSTKRQQGAPRHTKTDKEYGI
jgi:hypothetical protein